MAERSTTPDHLNFKKGWMTRLEEDGKWKKHWFVLTNQSLRFYRDSVAEEAADLDGEINLSTCFNITEFPVQRNYGFQIHTKDGVFTLCAMTSGIRRNWIQAVMKNVDPSVASDITCSLSEPKSSSKSCYPDEQKRSRIGDRRKEGRYKTFDWAEFSHSRQKREEFIRQTESGPVCGHSVPTEAAPSCEEPVIKSFTEKQVGHPQEVRPRAQPCTTDSSLLVVSSAVLATKMSGQESTEIGGVIASNDISKHEEQKKKADHSTLALPATYSSSSVQTDWHGDDFHDLLRDLKAEQDRRKREAKEFKVSESRLQAELSGTRDTLHETELKLQKAEATLLERESALQELRSCLEEVSDHLKATEEAHALKDVCLERQLCLLQESQERERRCLGDSLNHAQQRGRELEERLEQAEAELQKLATEGTVEALRKKCQGLQHQLGESDSELSRLQARLRNEETLYYDLEHNYERVCEELGCVRGALQDFERVSEERLEQELKRKEQELEEVLLKVASLGTELEVKKEQGVAGCWDNLQGVRSSWVTQQEVTNNEAMAALESEVYGSEEQGNLRSTQTSTELSMPATEDPDLRYHDQPLRSSQGVMLKNAAPNLMAYNGVLDFDLLEDSQEDEKSLEEQLSLEMLSKILSLEGLVVQKMASALESPSQEFLQRLLELQVHPQTLDEELVVRKYSEFLSSYQRLSEMESPLDEREICNLCVEAELAYLTCTNNIQSSQEHHKSEANHVPCTRSESLHLNTRPEEGSKPGFRLENVRLPELVPYKDRNPDETTTLSPEDMESLALELRTHSRSLQALSVELHPQDRSPDFHSEVPLDVLRAALFQATLVYVTSRLRLALQHQLHVMQACWEQAVNKYYGLEGQFQNQEEHYTEKLREGRVTIEMAELARESAETSVQIKEQEVQQLKVDFEKKLEQIQQIHEEEMGRVYKYYAQTGSRPVSPSAPDDEETRSVSTLKRRIKELEMQIQCLEEEHHRGDDKTLRKAYEQELETLKATCELGFSSMEQSHQRVIVEMQRQHQIEVERLMEEKDRALQEETDATIAAIEAMRKAYEEQLEKHQKAQQKGTNKDIHKLHAQFNEELESLNRELQVVSEQYSQKCLENANLSQTIETERQNLISAQRENKELDKRNQELSKCLAVELSRMQSDTNGAVDHAELFQGRDIYQLEVMLRVKESEIQCLKQEICSLKEELQASDRHSRKLLNELSDLRAKCPIVQRRAEAHKPQSSKCDVMKSKSNPDFLKDRSKQKQATRSKSHRDNISVQERMKIFESSNR
ncbi:myosin-11 [Trichomycterus rosablanca]|uniref:myosin-11 n=1 Tax=Trichomycterus rosablanca TaxID=2290929 RepID=UPI002F3603DF